LHHTSEDRLDPTETLLADEDTLGVPELEVFAQQGLITRIHSRLTSGKEATVYCCRAHPSTNRKFLAAKIYREHAASAYRRSGIYFKGRERTMKARTLRAIERGTEFGRQAMAGMWTYAEYDALQRLAPTRADVPRPFAMCGSVVLMEYIGNGEGPAPHLNGIDMDVDQAQALFDRLLDNVETLLQANLIHGDLSPYNVLVWKGRPWIIDLPQAVDARFNRSAFELLRRDIGNISAFFARHGTQSDPADLALDLWERYRRAEL
jgi:RIO kinase 1